VGVITSDARGTLDVQWRVSMTKVAFSKEILSTSTFDYSLRRNNWNVAFGTQLYMVLKLGYFKN
jgi:hypothetical protein